MSSASGPATAIASRARSSTATCAPTPRPCPSRGLGARASPASSPRYAASTTTWCAPARPSRTPPSCCPPRRRTPACRGCSAPTRSRNLLDRIPATTPLEVRDRAMFELAYSCGLRAEEIVGLDLDGIDFEAETLRVLGKGSKTRIVPVGEPAQRALERYLQRARPALVSAPRRGGAVPLAPRPPAVDLRRAPPARALAPRGGGRRSDLAAHAAPLVRDPPVGGRGRPPIDPGAARPCEPLHDPALHSGGAEPPAQRVRTEPSSCLNPDRDSSRSR